MPTSPLETAGAFPLPSRSWPPPWYQSLVLGTLFSVLAVLLRMMFEPWLGGRLPFIAMVPAVLASVWYGGWYAGLISVAVGGVYGDLISSQQLPWPEFAIDHTFALTAYFISMFIIVVLVDRIRRAEVRILALNARLQRSMAETHHRVKNNLQVVSALVEMPILSDQPEISAEDLQRIGQHIRGLAAIHELLTASAKGAAAVEHMRSREVFERLTQLFDGLTGGRPIRCDAEDVTLPVRQATALSVLVNELVNNAVKHGSGEIRLRFRTQGGRAQLEVSDRGGGFGNEFSPARSANTGLELVESVARWDLGGEVEYRDDDQGGARVIVTFPLPARAAAR